MAARSDERSALASSALQFFPPSIRDSLISDPIFRNNYGLKIDGQISFGDSGVSVQRSKLFNSIREILADRSVPITLNDTAGKEWSLEIFEKENERRVALSLGEHRTFLPDFSELSPDPTERMHGFDHKADAVHLPEQIASKWRELLISRALTDDEIDALHTDIKETPNWVASLIASAIEKGTCSLTTLVPPSERYFERLVGEYQPSQHIIEYVQTKAKEHIRQLLSQKPNDGLLLSLLLSSHSSISSAIEANQLEEKDFLRAYKWLQEKGDRISQIGAIEIGLSIVDKQPGIEPYVQNLIEQIRDDNPEDAQSRLPLLSALIVFVEGELSRTKLLRGRPPFWRRLASIAQASLIERCIINAPVDRAEFTQWIRQARGQFFYLQTLVDLRQEPRWYPDYVSPHQLKAEFIGRIINAAQRNDAKIHSPALRALLFDEGPANLQSFIESPLLFLSGPLEGGLESPAEPPAEILREIERQLNADVLQPHSFTALVNSALLFRLDSQQAQLAAKALRTVKYQLRQTDNKDQLFAILNGLASVAAGTRHDELAEDIKILTRKCRLEPGHRLSAEDTMRIGLIAAAAHPALTDWCEFVGEWITELAFQALKREEVERLHAHVKYLCHVVPELWRTCGKAEAALNAVMGT